MPIQILCQKSRLSRYPFKSCTRNIEGSAVGDLRLFDIPGQRNTGGQDDEDLGAINDKTIDVANSVSVTNLIKKCGSVRLLWLLDARSLEHERGGILARDLKMWSRFLKDLDKNVGSVMVLFTHCGACDSREIKTILSRLISENPRDFVDDTHVNQLVQLFLQLLLRYFPEAPT